MVLSVVLAVALLGLWLILSGHYTVLLVSLGVASSVLVTWIAARMRIVDPDGVPIRYVPSILRFWPWLLKEMFVSNVQVARIVLSPGLPIAPTLVCYRAGQQSDVGRVIFANSVTLTPGTLTTDVEGHDVTIHALAWVFVEDIESGDMNARVVSLEGGDPEALEPAPVRIVGQKGSS